MRVRAVVAYDGTDYSGFQRQANAPTVQEALEIALEQVTQEAVSILAAGRTDAGVHAAGQVIAFDTSWRHGPKVLQRALNAVLPRDVVVRDVERAALDFHPRYDAIRRYYRYSLYNAPVRCPLARRFRLHVAKPLDVGAMQQAAQILLGEHDFAAFGQPPQGTVTIRHVFRAEWKGEAPNWAFDVEANAFLYRMVRSIVGTLLQVGQGRMSVEAFENVLASRERGQAGPTAPPHGLCLIKVLY
ncbi:MAG TPA: tRNA pseudouridine(38-40) synthase TruA [Chloroflexi bacterium]|nr:tRNA pseudouridine(38-40) synthase TruA [Chloroflexota bacterium]